MMTKYIPQESRVIKSHKLASQNVIILYSGTCVEVKVMAFSVSHEDLVGFSPPPLDLSDSSEGLSSYRKDRRTYTPLP